MLADTHAAGFCRTDSAYLGTLLHYRHHGFPKTREGQVALLKLVSGELLAVKHYERYAAWKATEKSVATDYGREWRLLLQHKAAADERYAALLAADAPRIAKLNDHLRTQQSQSC